MKERASAAEITLKSLTRSWYEMNHTGNVSLLLLAGRVLREEGAKQPARAKRHVSLQELSQPQTRLKITERIQHRLHQAAPTCEHKDVSITGHSEVRTGSLLCARNSCCKYSCCYIHLSLISSIQYCLSKLRRYYTIHLGREHHLNSNRFLNPY